MEVLSDLFRFPIIMADGEIESRKMNKKTKYGDMPNDREDELELDVVIGEAEYPYNYFVGLTDRWLPNAESFRFAREHDKFDACYVTFANIGSYIVPWTKDK